uniref:Uncharacterized protein n=1 Tax=Kalanchoe fedtschenkoi TaxID=63787 RepID=A0A7N0ZZB4_KALFE
MDATVTADTTTLSYWLNWRVFACAILVLVALHSIWKYEGRRNNPKSVEEEVGEEVSGVLYAEEAWRPCLKQIHPAWLLAFRIVALCLLLATLIAKLCLSGAKIFFYYTQWTFTLLIVYFGFGSVLSIYGCFQHYEINKDCVNRREDLDPEKGPYLPLSYGRAKSISGMKKGADLIGKDSFVRTAGTWGYVFQILFQVNGGAVMLTDSVYWTVIFPFLTIKDYDLGFMTINLHSLNAVLLLGDTALNSMRFPLFRISYFILWTGAFMIFQWIIHACVSIWWPYPFLDLSSRSAPLWYMLVGLMQIPCYGIFVLLVKLKHHVQGKLFPSSYQYVP